LTGGLLRLTDAKEQSIDLRMLIELPSAIWNKQEKQKIARDNESSG